MTTDAEEQGASAGVKAQRGEGIESVFMLRNTSDPKCVGFPHQAILQPSGHQWDVL